MSGGKKCGPESMRHEHPYITIEAVTRVREDEITIRSCPVCNRAELEIERRDGWERRYSLIVLNPGTPTAGKEE